MKPRAPARRRAQAAPRPRASRANQRQRLIEACISALHVHGPSNTTVEKVVAIARMSPGIVRFYFDSKAAMLVASLEFLAAEFEQRVLVPVAALKATPVEALEQLVELYLGAEIASARKVSVWYSFWGEASSRQEYYDICGMKDDSFAALVRELIGRLIDATGAGHLDRDAVALGLIGALEMLWQEFAFQTESTIDRAGARRRAMAYLASVFPGTFGREAGAVVATLAPLPPAAYASEAMQAAERHSLFAGAWQFVGLGSELPAAGQFVAVELATARALVLRDASGRLRAWRNDCPRLPHALVDEPRGQLDGGVECRLHGLSYRLDGTPADRASGAGLEALELLEQGGCVFVRESRGSGSTPPPAVESSGITRGLIMAAAPEERAVAADWKVVVELWLEPASAAFPTGWTQARLAALGAGPPAPAPARVFLAPNQLLESAPGGLCVLQVVPLAPGACRVRCLEYTRPLPERAAAARSYLHRRQRRAERAAARALAASIQQGLRTRGSAPPPLAGSAPELTEFRRTLARLLPAVLP